MSKNLVPTSTALTAILSGLTLSSVSLIPMFSAMTNVDFNYTRSLVLSTVLFGNIGFTLIEAWPNLNSKRVLTITLILFVLPFAFCNIPVLQHYFHLHEVSNSELIKTLLLGVLASVPTFLFRLALIRKENGKDS